MNIENLKKARIKKGLSQKETAEQIGMSYPRYNHYETGKREPDNKTLTLIANFLDVSVDYLLGNEQKKEPLSNREEQGKDLSKQLDEILLELELQADGLMFSGQALDDRTKEALIISLRNAMELAEAMNKKEKDK